MAIDVCVIGGGPAGLMAAAVAASRGARVVLLEKNRSTGRKLLITGGGRCNVTNAEPDRHRLVERYGSRGIALHSVFTRFSSADVREFFASLGVPTKEEDEGRVFPCSNRAASVREALVAHAVDHGVRIRCGATVRGLAGNALGVESAVMADGAPVRADAFILATGGTSRPETGSTGDAFPWLAELGHTVRVPEPALVPMRVAEPWVADLQGIAFPDVKLTASLDGQRLESKRGKLLFTHFGLSGPLALNMAGRVNEIAQGGPVVLEVDLVPGVDGGELDRRIQAELASAPSRLVRNALVGMAPPRVLAAVLTRAGVDEQMRCSVVPKDTRKRICGSMKALRFRFDGLLGDEWAVVSSGGVDPREVDFSTMRSRVVANLFLVGDLLDFDRQSGGYSLQLCWATGHVAGVSAAESATASFDTASRNSCRSESSAIHCR